MQRLNWLTAARTLGIGGRREVVGFRLVPHAQARERRPSNPQRACVWVVASSPLPGLVGASACSPTKSEARAALKRMFGLGRLPAGTALVRSER